MPGTQVALGAEDDGFKYYRVLGLARTATPQQIKQAYRALARVLHPDKGGSSEAFGALQTAFEVLSNPKTRAVYDALAADVRFRPGAAAPYSQVHQPDAGPSPPPGVTEAMLLQQLLRHRAGSDFDPARQLCVTCEVCRRPATKECWTCGMPICEFCTRRQHWKGDVPLHWPLVDTPGRMLEQLGRQELEAKRKHDAAAYKASLPGYRPQPEAILLREFQDAIVGLLAARSAQLPGTPQCSSQAATTIGISNGTQAASAATAGALALTNNSSSSNNNNMKQSSHTTLPTIASFSLASIGNSSGSIMPSTHSSSIIAKSTSSTALAAVGGSSGINRCFKAWQAADAAVIQQLMSHYDARLARLYMWAQTPASVLLAVHMPTGGTQQPPKLDIEATPSGLRLQHQGFAPVISRAWHKAVDPTAGISSWVSTDGQVVCLMVPKAVPGQAWDCCFQGDSHGARCLQSPYRLLQLPHEVQLEMPLPFWVVPEEDLQVVMGESKLTVAVDGLLRLQRTYWSCGGNKGQDSKVVDVAASGWCVLEEKAAAAGPGSSTGAAVNAAGQPRAAQRRRDKVLSITLALPDPTQEEIMYQKGVRQNNAAACRNCPHGSGCKGYAFFVDDEDEFGLQCVLQALMVYETGRCWLSPKPWEVASGSAAGAAGGSRAAAGWWVHEQSSLPPEVQQHLTWLRAAELGREGGAGTATVAAA